MEESEGEGECGKRPHVTTGNTPHKPEDKRRRSTGSLPRSAKKLSFPRSPSNVVSMLEIFEILFIRRLHCVFVVFSCIYDLMLFFKPGQKIPSYPEEASVLPIKGAQELEQVKESVESRGRYCPCAVCSSAQR